MEDVSFPLSILVIAPFSGRDAGKWTGGPVTVSLETLDQVIADCSLSLDIPVPRDVAPGGVLSFPITCRKDFHPDNLILSDKHLKNIFEAKQFVLEAPSKGLGHGEIVERLRGWEGIPPLHIPDTAQETRPKEKNTIDEILDMVSLPERQSGRPAGRKGLIDQLDGALRRGLELVFHDDGFRNLEAAWAGLEFLLARIARGGRRGDIAVKILPSSRENLEDTIDGILLDMIRDIPSLIVVDFPVEGSSRGMALLGKLAGIGETLLAPVLAWIGPDFFHVDSWDDLEKLPYLPHHLERPEFAKWQKLKKSTSGRWVGIACNRFLERFPYGSESRRSSVLFQEPGIPWRSPVWGVAALICRSQTEVGWPSRFSEWKKFNLEDLALKEKGANAAYATEAALDENRIDQLIASGLIPLVSFKNRDMAFVPGDPTISGDSLAFQLVLSRIVQFVIRCKERFGKDLSTSDLEAKLESTLSRFWEKTGHPLPEDVRISIGKPDPAGSALVSIMIRPQPAILPSPEPIEFQLNW